MIKKGIFSFLLSLCCVSLTAGGIDTNYVQKFKNIFAGKLFLINNGYTYSIVPQSSPQFSAQQQKDAQVIFNPYIPPAAGISINVSGTGFTYVFKLTDDYLDTTGRAKSAFKQFQMNIYGSKFGFEGYYQDYQRFYYHYKGDEKLQQDLKNYNSDIRAYQFGANALFIFNGRKFSYNAAFNQTILQKKSASSALLTLSFKFNELSAHDLIPDKVKPFYGSYVDLQRNRNYAFLAQLGHAFILTKNNFYFSGALLAGAGIQEQTYTFPSDKFYRIAFPLVGRAKGGMGYNGKVIFTGIFANADVSRSSIKSLKTEQMIYSYGVFFGLRAVEFKKSKGLLRAEAKTQKKG